jgi:hypothetical protein
MAVVNIHCALGLRNRGVLLTPLRILQMRRAFIAAFTSEKLRMKIKKVYSIWAIDTKYLHGAFVNSCTMLN